MTHSYRRFLLIALALLVILPCAMAAVQPAWTVKKAASAIYPSADSSTIVTSGKNLLYLTNDGTIGWMDKPSAFIDVAGDGEYVVTAGPYATLYDRKGNKVWENENTGDAPSGDDPLEVRISRDGTLVLTSTSTRFHTWGISGGLIGTNTSYDVTDGNAYFADVAMAPSGDEIVFFTVAGIYAVNRSGALVSSNADDWKCRAGALTDKGRKAVCAYENRLFYGHTSGVLLWDKKIAWDTITDIAVSESEDPVIVAGSMDGYVYAVSSTGQVIWNYKLFPYRVDQPITVSVTNDGSFVSARSINAKTMKGAIFLFDGKGNLLFSTEADDGVGTLMPDGSALLVGTPDTLSSYSVAALASPAPSEEEMQEASQAAPGTTTMTTVLATPTTNTGTAATAGENTVPATTQEAPGLMGTSLLACAAIAVASARRN